MLHRITNKCLGAMLLAGTAVMGCGNQKSDSPVPSGWVRECPGEAFCFSRPANLVVQPGQVIDSLAASYRSDALTLTFDMGRYGTSVDHLVKPTEEAATIDGRPAQVLTTEREIVLVVPKVHERGGVAVKFSMTLRFQGSASRQVAQQVFQSIAFKPQR